MTDATPKTRNDGARPRIRSRSSHRDVTETSSEPHRTVHAAHLTNTYKSATGTSGKCNVNVLVAGPCGVGTGVGVTVGAGVGIGVGSGVGTGVGVGINGVPQSVGHPSGVNIAVQPSGHPPGKIGARGTQRFSVLTQQPGNGAANVIVGFSICVVTVATINGMSKTIFASHSDVVPLV